MLKITARGDKAILKMLGKLAPSIRRKVISKSARVAMRPVLAAARANAPRKTGALKRSVRMRAIKRNRKGRIGVSVVTSEKWFKGDEYYAAFQEFGWKAGKRPQGSRRTQNAVEDTRKQIPGKHYVERAYESHGDQALRTFIDQVPVEIERLAQNGG